MAEARAIFVDDDESARKDVERLGKYGLDCRTMSPPAPNDLDSELLAPIRDGEVDVVLLDYRLDDMPSEGGLAVSYRGGMLAAAVRELDPGIPIVLVTTEEKLRSFVDRTPSIRELFDWQLSKGWLQRGVEERRRIADQLIDLARGFRMIDEAVTRHVDEQLYGALRDVLALDEGEAEVLDGLLVDVATPKVARWLLDGLLASPGPLLDEGEARVLLGLTAEAFALGEVQAWAAQARYEGVFSVFSAPRWWEHRLYARLPAEAVHQGASGRSAAVAAACGLDSLETDRCTCCGGDEIQRVCSLCRRAVDATHHLTRVAMRPPWARPPVVCFPCIAKGRDEEERVRFGAGTHGLLEAIRDGAFCGSDDGL